VKELGGLSLKWVSPGFRGVPDQIVFMPGRRLYLCELKDGGLTFGPIQRIVKSMLFKLGFIVDLINSEEVLESFVGKLKRDQTA